MTPADNWEQRIAAFFFLAVIEYAAGLVMPFAPRNGFYYVAALLVNAGTYSVFRYVFIPSDMMEDLKKLMLLQSLIQILGLALWVTYVPPTYYNTLLHAVVLVTYFRAILGSAEKPSLSGRT